MMNYSKPVESMKNILAMPLSEHDASIAEWLMFIIGEFKKKGLPFQPQIISEYYKKDFKAQRDMNAKPEEFKAFWYDQDVKKYFDQVDMVNNYNYRNMEVLKWLKEAFQFNPERLQIIQNIMNDYLADEDKVVEQPAWTD